MAVTVEMQNTGDSSLKADVVASIEHALADRPGDWRVLIIGSQATGSILMKPLVTSSLLVISYTSTM